MEIQVTENRQTDITRFNTNSVRVFVGMDMHYGYWVNEKFLYDLLSDEQKAEYLNGNDTFAVSVETAQKIIDDGITPYAKPKLKK